MSVTVELLAGRDQGRDLDIYQIFGRIQGKSVARSRRGEKLADYGFTLWLIDKCVYRSILQK